MGMGLRIHNKNAVWRGIKRQDVIMWSQEERTRPVPELVGRAIALPKQMTPIFMGVEFLPEIITQNLTRPAILIEKSSSYFDSFLSDAKLRTELPENIKIIRGEWGIKSPYNFATFDAPFMQQEIGQIAFKLMQLPHELVAQSACFGLPEHPLEKIYFEQMYRVILSCTIAAQFHIEMRPTYQEIKKRFIRSESSDHSSNEEIGVLHLADDEKIFIEQYFLSGFKNARNNYFQFNTHKQTSDFLSVFFNSEELPREKLQESELINILSPFIEQTQNLLQWIKDKNIDRIIWRNRSIWESLESIIFAEKMLQHINIPCTALFADLFSFQSHLHRGGWGFEIWSDLADNKHTDLICMESCEGALYKPESKPASFLSFGYCDPNVKFAPALTDANKFINDIAIINLARPHSFHVAEINEIAELVIAFSPFEKGRALYSFLFCFSEWLNNNHSESVTYYWKSLLKYLHGNFYSQTRMRRTQEVVFNLSEKMRVGVYGKDWEDFIPTNIQKGYLSTKEMERVHNESIVTLVLSPINTIKCPHYSMIKCLTAGGLPIATKPTIDLENRADGFDCFNTDNLLFYNNVVDLAKMVEHFSTNIEERANKINQAQESWLKDLRDGKYQQDFQQASQKYVVRPNYAPQTFTNDSKADQFILEAVLGYFYSFSGYINAAVKTWENALKIAPREHSPLIARLKRTIDELN